MTKTIVTVTTAANQPSFTIDGRADNRAIAAEVKARYGRQVVTALGVTAALPHSFVARFEGAAVQADSDTGLGCFALAQRALELRSPGSRRWASC